MRVLALVPFGFLFACAAIPGEPPAAPAPAHRGFAPSRTLAAMDPAPTGDAPVTPVCTGVPLANDRTYDIELRSALVRGDVRVDGSSQLAVRGAILFVETGSGLQAVAPLRNGTLAPGAYDAALAPGTYDVFYRSAVGAVCTAEDGAGELPCNSGLIRAGVQVTGDMNLDLEIHTARVWGQVTSRHAPLTDAPADRGFVAISPHGGAPRVVAPYAIELGSAGGRGYATRLLTGSYDARYVGTPSPTPGAPLCGAGTFDRAHLVAGDGEWNLDIPSVHVGGPVTANGEVLVDRTGGHGRVRFAGTDGNRCTVDVPATGASTLAVALFPDTYDIFYEGAGDGVTVGDQLPHIGGAIARGLTLVSDGSIALDVPSVLVSGDVTVNGAPLVGAPDSRGTVYLRNADGGEARPISLGATGAVSYAMRMVPGHYEASFFGPYECAGEQLPCGGGVFVENLEVTRDGRIDLDIPVVHVAGTVTTNAQPIADGPGDRGIILLHRDDYYVPAWLALGTTGPVTYATRLIRGNYDIEYVAGEVAGPGSQLPANSGTFARRTIDTSGTLSLDIPSFVLTGTIQVNGLPMSPSVTDIGRIVMRTPADVKVVSDNNFPHNEHAIPLGVARPLAYAERLVATEYVITYQTSGVCDPSVDPATPPCTGQVLLGCVRP